MTEEEVEAEGDADARGGRGHRRAAEPPGEDEDGEGRGEREAERLEGEGAEDHHRHREADLDEPPGWPPVGFGIGTQQGHEARHRQHRRDDHRKGTRADRIDHEAGLDRPGAGDPADRQQKADRPRIRSLTARAPSALPPLFDEADLPRQGLDVGHLLLHERLGIRAEATEGHEPVRLHDLLPEIAPADPADGVHPGVR